MKLSAAAPVPAAEAGRRTPGQVVLECVHVVLDEDGRTTLLRADLDLLGSPRHVVSKQEPQANVRHQEYSRSGTPLYGWLKERSFLNPDNRPCGPEP